VRAEKSWNQPTQVGLLGFQYEGKSGNIPYRDSEESELAKNNSKHHSHVNFTINTIFFSIGQRYAFVITCILGL
jgi:hypothetical protein